MRLLPWRGRATPQAPKTDGASASPGGKETVGALPAQAGSPPPRPSYPSQLAPRSLLTVSEENGIIRVVAFRGWEVLAWGTAVPEPAHPDDQHPPPVEAGPDSRLRTLLKAVSVRPNRGVADLPLFAPLLRHLTLTKMDRRYLSQVVLSELMQTLPFAAEEVDVAWQVRRSGTSHEVFATAVPKAAVDQRYRLLKEANLRPIAVYSKAQALTLTAGVPDGIVAHIGPAEVTAVLFRERAPRTVYQVKLPEGGRPQEQAQAVARAVEVVADHYQTLDSGSEGAPLPVVLTGQLSSEAPLAEALRQVLPREVLPFAPPLVHPEQFSPAEYAINLGLALAHQVGARARRKALAQEVPPLNLLSERHLPRRIPLRSAALLLVLFLFSVAAMYGTFKVSAKASYAAQLSTGLEKAQVQERQQRLALNQTKGVQEKTRSVEQLVQGLEAELAGMKSNMEALQDRLGTITGKAQPPGVQLSSISLKGDSLSLSGAASNYEEVLQFTTNLRASPLFHQVRIIQAGGSGTAAPAAGPGGGEKGRIAFLVKVSLPPALQPSPPPK